MVGTWRLGRRPGLDGIRGVAVAFVVVSHLFPADSPVRWLGFFGVTVFFVLSGFLITALLLEEKDGSGRLDVVAFYARRARRLLPALLVTILAVSLVSVVVTGFVHPSTVVGALTYSQNLLMAWGVAPNDDALAHTWSLAVEEQFYLFWPAALLLLLRLPARWQGRVLAVVVVASALVPLTLTGQATQGYYGTEAHLAPLLVGGLLAWGLHHGRLLGPAAPVVALVALASVVPLVFVSGSVALFLAPQVVALLTAVAIWAAVRGPAVGWLEDRRLVLLGQRSYGLYLVHLPLLALLGRQLSGVALAAVAVPMAWGLTLLMWRYVERPGQRLGSGAWLGSWWSTVRTSSAVVPTAGGRTAPARPVGSTRSS